MADIYQAAKRRAGKYPPLAADTMVNSIHVKDPKGNS